VGVFPGDVQAIHKTERKARAALLDEVCVPPGYNRKHAIQLLNGPRPPKEQVRRPGEHQPHSGNERKIPQNIIPHRLAKSVYKLHSLL
jgi:hypothetical protein